MKNVNFTVLLSVLLLLSSCTGLKIRSLNKQAAQEITAASKYLDEENNRLSDQAGISDEQLKQKRNIIYRTYEKKMAEADKKLKDAFYLDPARSEMVFKNYYRYMELKDFRRSREWLSRIKMTDDYDPGLITHLLTRENMKTNLVIIEAMGYLRDPAFIDPLKAIIVNTKKEEELCFCLEALGRIGDYRAMEILEKYYEHETWGIRVLAGQALERITGREFPVDMPYAPKNN